MALDGITWMEVGMFQHLPHRLAIRYGPFCYRHIDNTLIPLLDQPRFIPTEPAIVFVKSKNIKEVWLLGGMDPKNSTHQYKTSIRGSLGAYMKFNPGPDLPIEMAYHCAIQTSKGIFVHGTHSDTFIYDLEQLEWITLYSKNPCGPYFERDNVQCGHYHEMHVEYIIVPTMTLVTDDNSYIACTAIFHVKDYTWSRLQHDIRTGFVGGRLIGSFNGKKLLYLGGINPMELDNWKPAYQLFQFDGIKEGWKLWSNNELAFPVYNTTLIPIPENVCDNPKMVKKISNMTKYLEYTYV